MSAYLATLERLEPLLEGATWVVPGHGPPVDGVRAAALLREDRAYLEALQERGAEAPLPLARRTAAQRRCTRRTWPQALPPWAGATPNVLAR